MVPVLSSTMVSIRLTPSSVAASLMRMLWRAPRPVPTATAVGVARPNASGQAITTAEIANVSDCRKGACAISDHERNVTIPAPTATTTSTAAARSAIRCPGAFDFCALSTRSAICARTVSRPTCVASARIGPVALIEPPTTLSPGFLCAGRLSPVTRDSSTSVVPSTTRPSTGIFSPGRTISTSPTFTSAVGTSRSAPSRRTRAIGGVRSKSALSASDVPRRDFISIQCPKSTKVTSMAAAS